MVYVRKRAVQFVGLDLSTGKIHMPPGAAQIDENGDRRRRGAWRVRAGYSRLLSNTLVFEERNEVTDDFEDMSSGNNLEDETEWTGVGQSPSSIEAVAGIAVQETFGNGVSGAYWNAQSFANDQYAEGSIHDLSDGSDTAGVAVRMSGTGGYAWVHPNTGFMRFIRVTWPSTWVVLKSFNLGAPLELDDVLRLEMRDDTLLGYINGALIGSVVDTVFGSGAPGLAWNSGSGASAAMDNFKGGDLVSRLTAIAVDGEPSRITAFERDDDEVKVLVAHGSKVTEFDAGDPEWTD